MINYLWAFMVVAGVLWGSFHGTAAIYEVSAETINSAKDAVELGIMLLGVVGMWCGVMKIAEEAGLTKKWAHGLEGAITFLFPDIPKNHPVRNDIATNMIANILGLGWAATPAGLKAMKGLQRLNEMEFQGQYVNSGSEISPKLNSASNSMCTLLVINISSLQLIPINIIAYRTEYQSANATAIIGPSIIATLTSTMVAIIFCKVICSRRK